MNANSSQSRKPIRSISALATVFREGNMFREFGTLDDTGSGLNVIWGISYASQTDLVIWIFTSDDGPTIETTPFLSRSQTVIHDNNRNNYLHYASSRSEMMNEVITLP